ncbi:hypothetical protein P43SY_004547 [Pythium insidiosum]|uniref:Disease resistance R13L4/SHOC-2-like LRR domain-containing protein n=1 Tax=Pythium insidiosum TaxID=114742 RepID=A0AAD5LQA3_PYTIN|nr:hypothetical protein P43SY_004547 [Pythium insidiosum]
MGAASSTAISSRALDVFEDALTNAQKSAGGSNQHVTLTIVDQALLVIPPGAIAHAATLHLRELRLINTRLGTLPASFGCLSSLERLSLERNDLQTLPLSFHELRHLTSLDLSKNQLQGLYGNFCDLCQLRELWLHCNELKALPKELGNLSRLELLDVHANRLTRLPVSFPCLSALVRLDASGNRLRALPEAFGNLARLEACNLSGNVLRDLPPHFGMLSSLRVLLLRQNALTQLPPTFGDLVALENLALSGNRIDVFPQGTLNQLYNLKSLTYAENRLKYWRPGENQELVETKDSQDAMKAASNQEDDNEMDETTTPETDEAGFFGLTKMEFLDFSENVLPRLPLGSLWRRLDELVELRLHHNKLVRLPEGLTSLVKLQRLDLSHNKLVRLPAKIGKLQALQRLDLSTNALIALPSSLAQCSRLDTLFLVKNPKLRELPDSLLDSKSLRWLEIDKSCFLAMPESHLAFCESLPLFGAE